MSKIVLFEPKLIPRVNFSNFQAEENFLDVSMRIKSSNPPDWPISLKLEHVLKIKTKSHKV